MWWTLAGWLQHMPALPRLLLNFSNIHYFWSIGPKIMKYKLPRSLFQGICSQKVSKNLKIKLNQVTLPKSGLSTVRTFGPIGVNCLFSIKVSYSKIIVILENSSNATKGPKTHFSWKGALGVNIQGKSSFKKFEVKKLIKKYCLYDLLVIKIQATLEKTISVIQNNYLPRLFMHPNSRLDGPSILSVP
jgi:hypothetical protein